MATFSEASVSGGILWIQETCQHASRKANTDVFTASPGCAVLGLRLHNGRHTACVLETGQNVARCRFSYLLLMRQVTPPRKNFKHQT